MWWTFSILRDQPSHTTLFTIGFRSDTRMETDALPMSPTSIRIYTAVNGVRSELIDRIMALNDVWGSTQ